MSRYLKDTDDCLTILGEVMDTMDLLFDAMEIVPNDNPTLQKADEMNVLSMLPKIRSSLHLCITEIDDVIQVLDGTEAPAAPEAPAVNPAELRRANTSKKESLGTCVEILTQISTGEKAEKKLSLAASYLSFLLRHDPDMKFEDIFPDPFQDSPFRQKAKK